MDYWTPLLLGLVGSLHCAGMCGPLALALPAVGTSPAAFVGGRLAYNLGRVTTYSLMGVVFGLVGRTLLLAGVQRWVSIALGLVLLAGAVSSRRFLRSFPRVPVIETLKARMAGLLHRRSFVALATLGLLNGLLPCGLVYVAAAGAIAAGGLLAGAMHMALFGLGTTPLMLSIGLSGRLMPPSLRLRLLRATPVAVGLVALLLILRGLSLGIPYLSPNLSTAPACH